MFSSLVVYNSFSLLRCHSSFSNIRKASMCFIAVAMLLKRSKLPIIGGLARENETLCILEPICALNPFLNKRGHVVSYVLW